MHWQIFEAHSRDSRDGLCIIFSLGSFPKLTPLLLDERRKESFKERLIANLVEMLEKNNVSWIARIDKAWSLNLEKLKEYFPSIPELEMLDWFKGQVLIEPEFEIRENTTIHDEIQYDADLLFEIIPEVINSEGLMRRQLTEGYAVLSQLEQSLRELIESRLQELYGNKWWKQGVPEKVRKDCDDRKKEKEKSSEISHPPIYYAYIGNYKDIIIRRDNWDKVFSSIFRNKTELEACFVWVGRVRDSIAHTRPVSDNDYENFLAGRRWLQVCINQAVEETG